MRGEQPAMYSLGGGMRPREQRVAAAKVACIRRREPVNREDGGERRSDETKADVCYWNFNSADGRRTRGLVASYARPGLLDS